MTISRRVFVKIGGLVAAGAVAAACSPAAAPAEPSTGNAPVGGAAPAGKAAWEKEWDDLVAAAKKEGKLSLLTLVGTGYRTMIQEFEKTFSGITVDQLAEASATVWVPKVQQERNANLYSFDVALVPPNSALTRLKPERVWEPVKPLLFRPDVLDDKGWRNGFNDRFMDVEGNLCFDWEYLVRHAFAINTDLVKEGEIKSVKDLLDPKWKGKMIFSDARFGDNYLAMANIRKTNGDAVVKGLLVDQAPTFSRDSRLTAEGVVRGRSPIALGVRSEVLADFKNEGLAKNVKFLDLPDADYVPNTAMLLFAKAPHPSAAKLFMNWYLTKTGQEAVCKPLPSNSARTDVQPYDSDGVGTPGKAYLESGKEANYKFIIDTQSYLNDLLNLKN
ncbi:MAG: extracellular solute-binding protein [Dehalococcoidia bacterium]|nr:extracellular solute-binding protein [Dehalococcoidia bacterium]